MDKSSGQCDPARKEKLAAFLRGGTDERIFTHPIEHPSRPSGFCPCDDSFLKALWFYFKGAMLHIALMQPFNLPKVRLLRLLGATIGENVYISVGVYIDPLFPELLTIEDNVMIGTEARIAFHEFDIDQFRAGRIILRKGCLIGAFSLLRPGVEVGENATVAAASVVIHDVPPGATAVGSPARIIREGS